MSTSSPSVGSGAGAIVQSGNATPPTNGTTPCPLKDKVHTVKVLLKWKDDGTNVPAAKCKIVKGTKTISKGPIASGILEAKKLEPGTYELEFADLDADELEIA